MKKQGLIGGLLLGAVGFFSVFVLAQTIKAQPLTQEQVSFSNFSADQKLTKEMWNGLINKLDTLAQNHEERIRALESAPAPVVPVAPAPGPDLNCKPQRFRFPKSIKFTTFEITEELKNGQSRRLYPTAANDAEIKSSSYPNGTAPIWTIEVRCDRGALKLEDSTSKCSRADETYSAGLNTCGKKCRRDIERQTDIYACPAGSTIMNGLCNLTGQPTDSRSSTETVSLFHGHQNEGGPEISFGNNFDDGGNSTLGYNTYWREYYRCDNGEVKLLSSI